MKELIPYDLFEVYEKNIKSEWKYNTFEYAHIFVNNIQSKLPTMGNEDELVWSRKSKEIMTELKQKGLARALDKIEALGKTEFKLTFPNGTLVRNVNDIFVLFQDNDWYKQDIERKRNYLHMFQYGIFRLGNDEWARTLENEWMEEYKISYNCIKQKQRKGCILKLILSRASDTIGKRFGETSKRCLDEMIVVRKTNKRKCGNMVTEERLFNGFHMGYLITKQKSDTNCRNLKHKIGDVPVDEDIKMLIGKCVNTGITKVNLMTRIDTIWKNNKTTGKRICST